MPYFCLTILKETFRKQTGRSLCLCLPATAMETIFPRSIFDLEESRGNVTYVLSDDIWTRQVPEDLLGRTIFLGPGEEVSLKDGAGNPVDIRAF